MSRFGKETEAWGHLAAGGSVKSSPVGLAPTMLSSCRLAAEGTIRRGPTCLGLPPHRPQQPQLTRSEGPVSQTPRIPSAPVAHAAGREAWRRSTAGRQEGVSRLRTEEATPALPRPSPDSPCRTTLLFSAGAGHLTPGPPRESPPTGTTGLSGQLASFEAPTAGGRATRWARGQRLRPGRRQRPERGKPYLRSTSRDGALSCPGWGWGQPHAVGPAQTPRARAQRGPTLV